MAMEKNKRDDVTTNIGACPKQTHKHAYTHTHDVHIHTQTYTLHMHKSSVSSLPDTVTKNIAKQRYIMRISRLKHNIVFATVPVIRSKPFAVPLPGGRAVHNATVFPFVKHITDEGIIARCSALEFNITTVVDAAWTATNPPLPAVGAKNTYPTDTFVEEIARDGDVPWLAPLELHHTCCGVCAWVWVWELSGGRNTIKGGRGG